MSDTFIPTGQRWQSPPPKRGRVRDEAARARVRRLEARFFAHVDVLALRPGPARLTLLRYVSRLHRALSETPPAPLASAIRADGHVDRLQDQAREEALLEGTTTPEVHRLHERTRREVGQKLALLASCEDELRRRGECL